MAKEPNDNREDEMEEEDFDLEDDDAAEGEDDETPSDADDEQEEEEDEDGSEEDSEDDDAAEDDEDEEGDEDEEEDPDYDPKLDPSGKFKGKSKKEIMQSYRNLETSIGDKAQKLAQEILKKKGVKAKPTAEDAEGEDGEDDFDLGLTDEQIAAMKPGEFGKHISRKILEKATEIARNTIDRTTEVRSNVQREIKEATAAHPHLKENADYREIVVNMIEAAASRNEVLSLKEACAKADKAMGIKPKPAAPKLDKDGKPVVVKKKNRMAVEKPGGSDGGKVKGDADRVREGLLGGASSSTGNLGGMGV